MTAENQKLLDAREEIHAILKKYDIGGYVVLHMPGWFENFGHYSPSYSRVKEQYAEDGHTMTGLAIVSKAEDYAGQPPGTRQNDMRATANMLSGMGMTLAQDAISFLDVSKAIDKALGFTQMPAKLVPRSVDQEVEVRAEEIYNSWKGMQGWKPWKPSGNSHKQDEARRLAREQLAKGG